MSENKRVFDVDLEDKKVKFVVVKPNGKVQQKAQIIHNKVFHEAIKSGAILNASIEKVMKEQNLWDETKQKRYDELVKSLSEGERKLSLGGKAGLTKKAAKELALQMSRDRREFFSLKQDMNQLYLYSAETQAQNARFNYYVAACTFYADSDKKPYFKDYEDYLAREDDPVVGPAADAMGKLVYGLDDDFEKKLPENKFLLEYGYVDDKLRLIDKDGKFIDSMGRRVDEEGYFINEAGERTDSDGKVLKVEFEPFLEEEEDKNDKSAEIAP